MSKQINFGATQYTYVGVHETYSNVYVYADKLGNKLYQAKKKVNGKFISCGLQSTAKESALILDKTLIKLGLNPINILTKK